MFFSSVHHIQVSALAAFINTTWESICRLIDFCQEKKKQTNKQTQQQTNEQPSPPPKPHKTTQPQQDVVEPF